MLLIAIGHMMTMIMHAIATHKSCGDHYRPAILYTTDLKHSRAIAANLTLFIEFALE
jgi:hypothetical protein